MNASPKTFPALKTCLIAGVLSLAAISTHALAECEDDQEALVGKTIAATLNTKLSPVIPGMVKQMINLDTCDASGAAAVANFKYNAIGADGLFSVVGTAKVRGNVVAELKITTLSPNLVALTSKTGTKLASN